MQEDLQKDPKGGKEPDRELSQLVAASGLLQNEEGKGDSRNEHS